MTTDALPPFPNDAIRIVGAVDGFEAGCAFFAAEQYQAAHKDDPSTARQRAFTITRGDRRVQVLVVWGSTHMTAKVIRDGGSLPAPDALIRL